MLVFFRLHGTFKINNNVIISVHKNVFNDNKREYIVNTCDDIHKY